jgi:beta-lactam-binding protein with PASTA domain
VPSRLWLPAFAAAVVAGSSSSPSGATMGNCTVPNVKGRTLVVAKAAITKANCDLGALVRAYSKKVAKGRVIAQSPGSGWVLPPGNQVQLTVSRGRRR